MKHKMILNPKYYNYILKGTKRIELRLYNEKRKNIKVNDEIEFLKEPQLEESFKAKVLELIKYDSFNKLIDNYDISQLADKNSSKEELIKDLEKFYPKEEQKKYGVIGIKIELINKQK